VPEKVWLELEGEGFWAAAHSVARLSPELARFSESLGYPTLLTPKRMPLHVFKPNSGYVRGYIHFGSGTMPVIRIRWKAAS